MPKLSELLAQKAALDKKIAEARRAERGAVIAQVRTLMEQYGLTLADLSPSRPGAGVASQATAPLAPDTSSPTGRRKGKPLGKVAPKYRDPASGATWSGRGLKPRWLSAALAGGRTLDEFRI